MKHLENITDEKKTGELYLFPRKFDFSSIVVSAV